MADKVASGAISGAATGASAGPWGALAGGLLGGIMGAGASSGDDRAAKEAADRMVRELIQLGTPPETAGALVLEKFHSAGQLTPALEQYIQSGPSKVEGITEDPALKKQQMSALELLSQRATGGLNPEDRAKFNELRAQANKEQEANQASILQNAQARGMAGSGSELAAQLLAGQAGANRMSQGGDQLAATASQNALQAALQSGQLGSQIRGQDFSVNQAKASAADEMNRFNVQNKTAQQGRNIQAQNQAQQYNLTNAQNIGNANAQMANNETARQNQARLNDYNNKVDLAKLKSGAYGAESGIMAGRAQQTRDQAGQIGGALGQFAGAYLNSKPDSNNSNMSNSNSSGTGYLGTDLQFAHGGIVPGIAPVEGDHPANDIVPAHLSPGELVLPKSIMESHDPGDVAKKFVQYVQALNKKPEYKYGKDSK